MSTLRSTPFDLDFQDLVVVIVRAMNSLGWGSYSAPNAVGAMI
jgi:hypothetical protein